MPSPNNPNAPAWIVVRRESTGCCNVLISVGMLKRSSCWVDRFASRNPILCLCETQVPVLKVVQSRKTVVCFGVRDSTTFADRIRLRCVYSCQDDETHRRRSCKRGDGAFPYSSCDVWPSEVSCDGRDKENAWNERRHQGSWRPTLLASPSVWRKAEAFVRTAGTVSESCRMTIFSAFRRSSHEVTPSP
jgi:hypothetical protein